jgi:hypothetical protein
MRNRMVWVIGAGRGQKDINVRGHQSIRRVVQGTIARGVDSATQPAVAAKHRERFFALFMKCGGGRTQAQLDALLDELGQARMLPGSGGLGFLQQPVVEIERGFHAIHYTDFWPSAEPSRFFLFGRKVLAVAKAVDNKRR